MLVYFFVVLYCSCGDKNFVTYKFFDIIAMGGDSNTKGSQLMQRLGEEAKIILTKFWIWVVASVLFGIGITGERMTIFRIIYMALALIFLLTFQVNILLRFFCFVMVIFFTHSIT